MANSEDLNGGNIVIATNESVENINEIHNYLQNFQKEIGDQTVSATATPQTYFTIDASQVCKLMFCFLSSEGSHLMPSSSDYSIPPLKVTAFLRLRFWVQTMVARQDPQW